MDADTCSALAVAARHRDRDLVFGRRRQPPERGCRPVTNCRRLAASQDCRKFTSARQRHSMAHEIYPSMQAVQDAAPQTTGDLTSAEPCQAELGDSDEAELSRGHARHGLVRAPTALHKVTNRRSLDEFGYISIPLVLM